MDSNVTKKALDIADEALELNDQQRARFIAEACGGDEELRSEVECLLEHSGDITIAGQSSPTQMPKLPPVSDRFHIRDELSRGGMGVVFFAYDTELEREVAVKVLQKDYLHRPDIVRRFLQEAKVCGKMQHPGTPPVYACGTLNDGRPFIAMKLVRGDTLSSILKRPRAETTQAWLFTIFKRICETIAYAHSLGIIHRDLKPDNVMVSQFGDVQVMDWGLAKTLSEELSDEPPEGDDLVESFTNAERISNGSGSGFTTRAGLVMGTPAYMPPEQMRGERAPTIDVFQLGAILCEILTGRPPYHSESPIDVYSMARNGELKDALDRLELAESDPELIDIARKCLEISPADRFADAGELVSEVVAYLNSVRTRLQELELAAARTETRIAEERKRRWIVAGLSSVMAVALIGSLTGLSWAMILRAQNAEDAAAHARELAANAEEIASQTEELARVESMERRRRGQIEARFNTALLEATRLVERAKAGPLHLREPWDDARAAIARTEALVELNPEIQSLKPALDELKGSFQSTEAELKIALDVTQSRDATFEDPEFVPWGDTRPKLSKLDRVVSDNGFHPDSHADEPVIVDRIRSLPWAIRDQLIGAMDEWYLTADDAHRETFTEILQQSDPDPLRKKWRVAFTQGDEAALEELFTNRVVIQLPGRSLVNFIRSLEDTHIDVNRRIDFLQRLQSVHANDAWYNYLLADLLQANNRVAESIPYYQAFVVARPNHRAHVFLAYALLRQQSYAEAVAHLRSALRERPATKSYRSLLIYALMQSGRYEEAVAFCEESLRLNLENTFARLALGAAHLQLGEYEESIGQLRILTGNVPAEMSWQVSLLMAEVLREDGQTREALQVFEAIDFDKNPLLSGLFTEALCKFAVESLQFSHQETDQADHWGERARQWLQICLTVQDFDPRGWDAIPTLAAMRQSDVLVELTDAERSKWDKLWNRADAIAGTSHRESDSTWTPVTPSRTDTYSGANLVPQPDGSFFVQGSERSRDVYTLTFREQQISAIRLELIPDGRLPNSGPGQGASGTFELGELALNVVSEELPHRTSRVPISRCLTDQFREASPLERCVDGNLQTAWRSGGESGAIRSAILVLEQPLVLKDGDQLQLHLQHGGIDGAGIGRFRISVSKQPFVTRLSLPTLVLTE